MLSKAREAVSPIISMILLIMIMLVVTAGIMQWATPVIQRAEYESHYRAAQGYFTTLATAIEDVVNAGIGSTREVSVSIGAGELYFGSKEWWNISYKNATGIIENASETSSIEHKIASPFGTYLTRFENLGVVTQAVGERWVLDEPMIVEKKNYTVRNETIVYIYILSFRSSGIKSGTAGNYKFSIRLNLTKINETIEISNLTLKITGEWRETWYSWLLKDYEVANATGNVTDYIGWAPRGEDKIIYKTAFENYPNYLNVANNVKYRAIIYDLEITLKTT